MRQEVNYLSERQEIFRGTVEEKIRLQTNQSSGKVHEQIFKEMKELEEKKSEEAPPLVQKKHDVWRYQNERDAQDGCRDLEARER